MTDKVEDKEMEMKLIGVNVSSQNLAQIADITEDIYGENLSRMQSATIRYCINFTHKAKFGDQTDDKA